MRSALLALIALLAGAAGAAQPRDLTQSADCREALAALNAQEDEAVMAHEAKQAASGPGSAVPQQLQALRRQAARACLGGNGSPAPAAQHYAVPRFTLPAEPAVAPAIPLPSAALPAPGATTRTGMPPPVAPAIPRPAPMSSPTVVTTCDATGCWASDGSRLQRMGPNLLGPHGICTGQGPIVQCP